MKNKNKVKIDNEESVNSISFIAALNSTSAIKIDGEAQCKVTFEVPASELANVIKLVLFVGKTFKVVIESGV